MTTIFSKFRRVNIPLLTILVIIIPVAIYFLYYLPSQEKYYIQRNFRSLKDLSNQVKSKIENLANVLHNTAGNALGDSIFIFPLTLQEDRSIVNTIKSSIGLVPDISYISAEVKRETLQPAPHSHTESTDEHSAALPHEHFALYRESSYFEVRPHTRLEENGNSLHYAYDGTFYKDNRDGTIANTVVKVTIHAKSDLNAFLKPILSREFFDDMLIVQTNGKVLFQLGGTELLATELDSLSDSAGKSLGFSSLLHKSNLINVHLGGTDYKLFTQPIEFYLLEGAHEDSHHNLDEESSLTDPRYMEWVLCGLVESGRFRSSIYAISYNIIIGFIFLVLLLAFSWPILKIWQMGPRDRLRVADMLFIMISGLVGSGILTFSLLDGYYYSGVHRILDEQLREFAGEIKQGFETEFHRAYHQLHALNSRLPYHQSNCTTILESICGNRKIPPDSLAHYPLFDLVFWADGQGKQQYKWTTKNNLTPHISVAKRPYFKRVNDRQREYWIEPIYSWTTGENEVIMSMPYIPGAQESREQIKKITVAAIDFQPLSLIKPLAPEGFGFCIINREGKVLFHSDDRRNLRENFIVECDNDDDLRAAVYGRIEGRANVKYTGQDYRLYITPMQYQDWTLITFRDKSYSRTLNLEIITISLILFILYILMLLIILAVTRILRTRYRLDWLWPDPYLSSSYPQLVAGYMLLGALYLIGTSFAGSSATLVMTFLLPLVGIAFTFLKLKRDQRALDSALRANSPEVADEGQSQKSPSADFYEPIQLPQKYAYRFWYLMALVTLVMLLAVLPAIAFFKIAWEQERVLFVKDTLYHLAKSWTERAEWLETPSRTAGIDPIISRAQKDLTGHLGRYYKFYYNTRIDTATIEHLQKSSSPINSLAAILRLPFNRISIQTKGMVPDESLDHALTFLPHKTLSFQYRPNLVLTSVLGEINPFWRSLWLLLIGLAVIAGVLFLLLRFIAERTFFLGYYHPHNLSVQQLSHLKFKASTLVIGPPLSQKSARLQKRQAVANPDIHLIDFIERINKNDWSASLKALPDNPEIPIVLDHFEHEFENRQILQKKFQYIETLLNKYHREVIIISTLDPFEHLPRLIKNEQQAPEKEGLETGNMLCWAGLLGQFEKIYLADRPEEDKFSKITETFRQKVTSVDRKTISRGEWKSRSRLCEFFIKECRVSSYLQRIAGEITKYDDCYRFNSEKQLLEEINDRTGPYYRLLWSSCTPEEKLLLIHLAEDGMVHSRNTVIVRGLLRKQLIKHNPAIRIMNESFRQYIHSVYQPQDLALEGTDSRWNSLKRPLLVILAGILIFLFTTQQELMNTSVTIITAIATLIPTMARILGFFPVARKSGSTAES